MYRDGNEIPKQVRNDKGGRLGGQMMREMLKQVQHDKGGCSELQRWSV